MSNTAVLENALLPLRPLLAREDVTELVINKAGEAAIETRDGWSWETLPDLNEKSLLALARAAAAFTHQDISQSTPIRSEEHTSEIQSLMHKPIASFSSTE